MKVLIVGGGGREHALAWKMSQSGSVNQVFVAPGNAGTATENKTANIDISAEDIEGLLSYAQEEKIDLTLVGPEAPLVSGIVDEFHNAGLHCFGPSKAAAMLEGSKSFTKDFLIRHQIPTATYNDFTDLKQATTYLESCQYPLVVKADGLAAGKGVIIASDPQQATDAAKDMLAGNRFGEAGHRIVVEAFLEGEEASFIVITDGINILPLATSQDHKARDDGDQGPNTGGMGAYSPAPVITDEMHQCIMQTVIEPTVQGMAADGTPYVGFLYAGLMITPDGIPHVLEFNCRFGDPETQPIMMRMQGDLAELCHATLEGALDKHCVEWDPRPALGVVLAAEGYPASARQGDVIQGLDNDFDEMIKIFHAGTRSEDSQVVTAGGRVLCVTALGENIIQAQQNAYSAIKRLDWPGMFYRSDIGYRAINRED